MTGIKSEFFKFQSQPQLYRAPDLNPNKSIILNKELHLIFDCFVAVIFLLALVDLAQLIVELDAQLIIHLFALYLFKYIFFLTCMSALSKQDNKISLQSSGIPTNFQSNPFAKGGLIKLWKSNIHERLKGFIQKIVWDIPPS